MIHKFNIYVAKRYGIESAILIQNICHWIDVNKANGRHYHDGYFWTYNTSKAFKKLFPYMSDRTIARKLKTLEELGIIKTGNYNKISYDRTKWYTVIDKSILSAHCIVDSPNEVDPFANLANGSDQNGEPIPDGKPDDKPYSKQKESKDSKKTPFSFEDFWAVYDFKKGKALAEKKYSKLSDTDKQKIKDTLKFYIQETVTKDLKGGEFKPMRKQASSYITQEVWKDYEGVEDKSTDLAKEFLKTGVCMPNGYLEIFGMTEDELRALYRKSTDYASQEGFDNFKIDYIKKKYSLD